MQNHLTSEKSRTQLALIAKAEEIQNAEIKANGGRPVTRLIDGVTYHKQYRILYPLPGSDMDGPEIHVSWSPVGY